MRVRYTQRAVRQLHAIHAFIDTVDAAAARQVMQRIGHTIDLLSTFPNAGRHGVRAGTRENRVPGLRYVVVHRLEGDDTVVILGVYHTAQRRPGQHL